MNIEQWPLTAAATHALLKLPPHDAKRGKPAPPAGETVKLALKELLLRGCYRIEVEKRRLGKPKVRLIPIDRPQVPQALADFDRFIRPQTPDEISAVIKASRKRKKDLFETSGKLFLGELSSQGLAIERRETTLFGLISAQRWRRTASGDAWAADAEAHLERLESLPDIPSDTFDEETARTLAAAGAATVMVPATLPLLARLEQRRRDSSDPTTFAYVPLDGGHGATFDPFEGAGGLLDSALGDAFSGVDSISDAIDSMSSSIDSGVSSGVDSGGGGDGGGGGGDGGGGGGNGGGGG